METVKLNRFVNGKNNIADEDNLPEGSLREAINVNTSNEGELRRRSGVTKIYTGLDIHSLFRRFFVENNSLKYLKSDNTAEIVNANITGKSLSYAIVNGGIYYADAEKIFNSEHTILGLEDPQNSFTLSNTSGGLKPGPYQVAINFVNKITGEISGSTNSLVIEVTNGGIQINNIPQPVGDYNINIYVSDTAGNKAYLYTTIQKGFLSIVVTSRSINKHQVITHNLKRLPGGNILRAFKGRLYVAVDNMLVYSQPTNFGLYNPATNFYYFKDSISIVQPVDDGIYVVADKTYFISGSNPEDSSIRTINLNKAIPGTGITVDASNFDLGSGHNGDVAYWFSTEGGILGLPSGSVMNISKSRLAAPNALTNGSTGYTESNGIRNLVTTMKDSSNDTRSNVGASDRASAQIIRNGVVL